MKKLLTFIVLLFCIVITGGCGEKLQSPEPKSQEVPVGYFVTDSRGKTIAFSKKPQRIVSSHVFADEILLDLVDHKRIAGLSKWVHDPGLSSSVEQAKEVSGVAELNMESIISLSPDVVILADNVGIDFITSLEDAGLKVYVFHGIFQINEIAPLVKELAAIVGENEKGQELIRNMTARLESLAQKVSEIPSHQRKIALLVLRFGAIGGLGSIYHDSLTAVGLRDGYDNVRQIKKTDTSMILSKEEVVKVNPEILIFGSWTMGGKYKNSETQLAEFYEDPAYASVTAIMNKHVIIIPQRYVNCLSHHVGEALENLYASVNENGQ
jgi:iron complex transport system substrate-binding protein